MCLLPVCVACVCAGPYRASEPEVPGGEALAGWVFYGGRQERIRLFFVESCLLGVGGVALGCGDAWSFACLLAPSGWLEGSECGVVWVRWFLCVRRSRRGG